jgi:hypothetical protein
MGNNTAFTDVSNVAYTREELEAKARKDFASLPKYMRVLEVSGHDENGDNRDFEFEEPGLLVRVDKLPPTAEGLSRWCDNWLDPFWPVTPMQYLQEMDGVPGWEIYGTSYHYPDGRADRTTFTPASWIERLVCSMWGWRVDVC